MERAEGYASPEMHVTRFSSEGDVRTQDVWESGPDGPEHWTDYYDLGNPEDPGL